MTVILAKNTENNYCWQVKICMFEVKYYCVNDKVYLTILMLLHESLSNHVSFGGY